MFPEDSVQPLRVPNAHDFCVISARTKRILRDFPRAKLDSEINAVFFLNQHGDLYFYYTIFVYKL